MCGCVCVEALIVEVVVQESLEGSLELWCGGSFEDSFPRREEGTYLGWVQDSLLT